MTYKYIKAIVLGTLLTVSASSKAQLTTIYSENFGAAGITSFPAAWTIGSTTGDWLIDAAVTNGGGVPDCTVPGSSGLSVMAGADGSGGLEASVSASFVTVGFTGINVSWNGYRSTGAPAVTLAYSFDDVTYFPVAFTDVTTDDAWHALAAVVLPGAVDGQTRVYLKWSYTGTSGGSFIAFDDLLVEGTASPTYYWDGVNPIEQVSSWGLSPDGSGPNPTNFTTNNQQFNLYNNTSGVLTGALSLSGTNVNLSVGGGTTNINFTIPAAFALSISGGAKMTVQNNSTLTVVNTATFAASTWSLLTGSTVDYAQASSYTIVPTTHYNLSISGGSDKSQTGNLTISNILNLNGSSLIMSNSSLLNLTLNGSVTGTGTLKTGNTKLNIGGAGNIGTLTFGIGSTTRTVNQFLLNRTSSGLVTLGSDLTVNSTFSISNGQVDLNNNKLTMNGAIINPVLVSNGSFIGSATSSITIGGAGAITNSMFFDQTSSSTRTLKDLLYSRTGVTLNLGNALEIWGSITPSVGTIASGNFLTLKSDASNKGRIGIINATGFFTGNPTVEVFHTSGVTGWVNLCSGGVTGQTMANWNSSFAMSCSTCPITDVGGTAFASVYSYDETQGAGTASNTAHYIEIGATGGLGTAINQNAGYWVYLGDSYPGSGAITVVLSGAVNTKISGGNIPLSLTGGVNTENGWNLIANPYPSPILVSALLSGTIAANVDNTLLVYDPNTDSNVPFTAAGTNSIIPMGQGFMIRALTNPVTLVPAETWKTTTASNVGMLKSAAPSPTYYYNDFMLDLTSTSISKAFFSQAYFNFGNSNTNSFDNGKDAFSLVSAVDPGTPRIISTVAGSDYLRNALPSITGTITIPVKVATGYPGVYSISPVNLNNLPSGACVTLYDIANNVSHDLRTGAYTATISANAVSNQFELRITVNNTSLTSSSTNPVCKNQNTGFVKATGTTAGPWNYTWKDVNHNVVRVMNNKTTADTLQNIYEGTYYVDISTTGSCDNAAATFNLLATTPQPVALFSSNTATVNDNSNIPVSFTNTSSNAVSYTWDFGDGTNANTAQASHAFNGAGSTYVVKLTASNGACNDLSEATQEIQVLASAPVNVAQNVFADNNLLISRDENGVFVQLNFNEVITADINVTNVLGQVIIAKKQISGDKTKVYLSIPENEKIVFVTVSSDNKKQTTKIIN